MKKPDNWHDLKLFEKLLIYKDQLDETVVPFVDKILVKDYILETLHGDCKVAKILKHIKHYNDIHQEDLQPGKVVIKSTHASGWNIFVSEKTDLQAVKKRVESWNKPYIGNNETHYSYLTPGFFIEERISDFIYGTAQKAVTFMIRCVQGIPLSINVRNFVIGKQNNYFMDGTLIDGLHFPFTMPPEVDKMIEFAKYLSKQFEFVRVDFFLSDNRDIYFSEFTFTPSGGIAFYPEKYEIEFGKLWL